MRSLTSTSVVYSSRTNPSKAEPVVLITSKSFSPDVTRATSLSFPADPSTCAEKGPNRKEVDEREKWSQHFRVRGGGVDDTSNTDLDFDGALLVAVPVECVRMLLGSLTGTLGDGDSLPSELLYSDECFLEVSVLGDEVGAEMEGEPLGNQDMGGCLGDVYPASTKRD